LRESFRQYIELHNGKPELDDDMLITPHEELESRATEYVGFVETRWSSVVFMLHRWLENTRHFNAWIAENPTLRSEFGSFRSGLSDRIQDYTNCLVHLANLTTEVQRDSSLSSLPRRIFDVIARVTKYAPT